MSELAILVHLPSRQKRMKIWISEIFVNIVQTVLYSSSLCKKKSVLKGQCSSLVADWLSVSGVAVQILVAEKIFPLHI